MQHMFLKIQQNIYMMGKDHWALFTQFCFVLNLFNDKEDKQQIKKDILNTLDYRIKSLLETLSNKIALENHEKLANSIKNRDYEKLKELYNDSGIQKILDTMDAGNRSKLQYLIERIDVITSPDYQPTEKRYHDITYKIAAQRYQFHYG